jgi:hypothetical protein
MIAPPSPRSLAADIGARWLRPVQVIGLSQTNRGKGDYCSWRAGAANQPLECGKSPPAGISRRHTGLMGPGQGCSVRQRRDGVEDKKSCDRRQRVAPSKSRRVRSSTMVQGPDSTRRFGANSSPGPGRRWRATECCGQSTHWRRGHRRLVGSGRRPCRARVRRQAGRPGMHRAVAGRPATDVGQSRESPGWSPRCEFREGDSRWPNP